MIKKLWLVSRTGRIGWDEYDAHVVRAETELDALRNALTKTGEEGESGWVTCNITEIPLDGEDEIILSSFNAG